MPPTNNAQRFNTHSWLAGWCTRRTCHGDRWWLNDNLPDTRQNIVNTDGCLRLGLQLALSQGAVSVELNGVTQGGKRGRRPGSSKAIGVYSRPRLLRQV